MLRPGVALCALAKSMISCSVTILNLPLFCRGRSGSVTVAHNVLISASVESWANHPVCFSPSSSDDYGPTPFTDAQWSRMQALFRDGICDFSKPGVSQQPTIPWQTYQDRNGSVIYGGTAFPPAPAGSGTGWSSPAFRSSASGFASGLS